MSFATLHEGCVTCMACQVLHRRSVLPAQQPHPVRVRLRRAANGTVGVHWGPGIVDARPDAAAAAEVVPRPRRNDATTAWCCDHRRTDETARSVAATASTSATAAVSTYSSAASTRGHDGRLCQLVDRKTCEQANAGYIG